MGPGTSLLTSESLLAHPVIFIPLLLVVILDAFIVDHGLGSYHFKYFVAWWQVQDP